MGFLCEQGLEIFKFSSGPKTPKSGIVRYISMYHSSKKSPKIVRDNEESGRVKSGTTGCDCTSITMIKENHDHKPSPSVL